MERKVERFVAAIGSLLTVLSTACPGSDEAGPPGSSAVVREAFLTGMTEADDIDSLAVWYGPEGRVWVLATAKGTHRVIVYDGTNGTVVRRFGRRGSGPGEFLRPNGIAVIGDIAVVVERDNARVQVFRLPGFDAVATLGGEVLRHPYGAAVFESAPGVLELYVTDGYRRFFGLIPFGAAPAERIKHFRVRLRGGAVQSRFIGAFGAVDGAGVLERVESLAADPERGHLLVADEASKDVKVYTLSGEYSGRSFGRGIFRYEPEGIALYACGERGGYWIAADQDPEDNAFHVFDRITFAHLGSFSGSVVRHTDGVALTQRPVGTMAVGAFYAVHHDRGVGAFGWAEVARALGLRDDCIRDPRAAGSIPAGRAVVGENVEGRQIAVVSRPEVHLRGGSGVGTLSRRASGRRPRARGQHRRTGDGAR